MIKRFKNIRQSFPFTFYFFVKKNHRNMIFKKKIKRNVKNMKEKEKQVKIKKEIQQMFLIILDNIYEKV